jgi:hypothetical protein
LSGAQCGRLNTEETTTVRRRIAAMAKTTVYGSFEVREGFGPLELGRLDLTTTSRRDADMRAEEMWAEGRCVQVFGIKNIDGPQDGERVLLRSLVAQLAA